MRESIHSSDLRQRSKSEASLYKLGCPRFGGPDAGYVLSGRMHAVTDKISGDVQDGQRTTVSLCRNKDSWPSIAVTCKCYDAQTVISFTCSSN
ncbi:hypothetical protein KIN20_018928 [Parelaphostrongylus tenuis]|uniref:Uncharacterized protein n=1 Tax=Parelaphostrongylus tenuis TaxID=148309 RepID=A0AAD5MQL4_PARTN|nr:hypothetical protein KIN20_018928 [Parelaphostrongylus tenuis]